MTKYEEILATRTPDDTGLELENAINEAYSDKVTAELTAQGYEVQGVICLYKDLNLSYLWHVYDRTIHETIALDMLFNVKTELLRDKFGEVG
ncbi:MAG: hypothetical protein R3Y63_14340 [Eubacteriales bacterium]